MRKYKNASFNQKKKSPRLGAHTILLGAHPPTYNDKDNFTLIVQNNVRVQNSAIVCKSTQPSCRDCLD